jgi:hypothetical protein
MKLCLAIGLIAAAVPLQGAEPSVTVWPAAELAAYGRKLSPKMDEKKLGLELFPSFGNARAWSAPTRSSASTSTRVARPWPKNSA